MFIVLWFCMSGSIILTAQTPLYFNIISHNESSDPLDYDGNQADYNTIRPLVNALCDTIIAKQARYNMQVDANFIRGVLQWEDGSTNPSNLLEWAHNSPFIDVDGHNHFIPKPGPGYNPYNFTDLAHLLDSCGVHLTHHTLGGVTYADTVVGNVTLVENWTQYTTPKAGYSFPDVFWQADIVWGTASPGHVADYTHFGIWKPAGGSSPTQFGTHDPNGVITHIGGGCKEDVGYILVNGKLTHSTDEVIANIKQVVDDIQQIPPSSNDFYTMNMLINFRDIPEIPKFADSIARIIDGLQPDVEAGKIIWATLGEKYDLWYAQHPDPNDYFNYDCADIVLSTDEGFATEDLTVYPNPTSGTIWFNDGCSPEQVLLFDMLGRTVKSSVDFSNQIDLTGLVKGVYFLKIDNYPPVKVIRN